MNNKDEEQILVVPSEIIFQKEKWQGLKTDNLDYYLDLIENNCQFKRRGDVEDDPDFQQIIPYMLFSQGGKFFAYKYIKNAGETRLINNDYQLGVGGHINKEDIKNGGNVLKEGMEREWEEEVDFRGNFLQKKLVGIINDDSRPVERVHLGLVYHFVGDSCDINVKEIDKMEGKLFELKDIAENMSHSPWMKIVYDEYLKNLVLASVNNSMDFTQKKDTVKNNYQGKLIVIEGTDCSGKATQAKMLVDKLNSLGLTSVKLGFPRYGSPTGDIVGDCYLGKNQKCHCVEGSWFGVANQVPSEVASLYYAADRKFHAEEIEKLLESGTNVILDRYVESNMGHQGGKIFDSEKREEFFKWLSDLEYKTLGLPKPDKVVFLYMPYERGMQLKKTREGKADGHESSSEHLKNAELAYLHLSKMYNWTKVICDPDPLAPEPRSPEEIHEEVFKEVKKVITSNTMSEKRRIYTLPNNLMPEVRAVTFAKCSRSPEPFDKIAEELTEEKSSEFNEKWVVGFGHSSIAEHAVISLAVEGVSILATKVIEDSRLASYTEKSTRYQVFDRNKIYHPEVLMNSELKDVYENAVNFLMDVYTEMTLPMMEFVKQKYPKPADQDEKLYNMVSKARACDNLRYLLPCATLTNLGMTINTRELEHLIKKLLSHPLKEMQDIGSEMKVNAMKAVPTLIKFANKNPYMIETKKKLKEIADNNLGREAGDNRAVTIVDYDKDAEDKLVASILYPYSDLSYKEIAEKVKGMSQEKKSDIIEETLKRRDKFDAPLRELEHVYYTFDILLDYGAFRDVQRHRMCTQSNQAVTTAHGYDMPPEIREAGFEDKFKLAIEKAVSAYDEIYKVFPEEAQYVVPLCFRKRVLITWNLRELHHFISLRSGKKGHASYRRIAQQCWRELDKIQPLLAKYIRVDMDEINISWAASLENKDFYYNPYAARNK